MKILARDGLTDEEKLKLYSNALARDQIKRATASKKKTPMVKREMESQTEEQDEPKKPKIEYIDDDEEVPEFIENVRPSYFSKASRMYLNLKRLVRGFKHNEEGNLIFGRTTIDESNLASIILSMVRDVKIDGENPEPGVPELVNLMIRSNFPANLIPANSFKVGRGATLVRILTLTFDP